MDLKDIVHDPARLQIFDIFLEEACRQWYAFIEEDLERADGEGFAGFFYEIFEMKENEMLEDLNAHVNASVERILAGDRTKLPVTKVTSEALMQELADYRKSGARADAFSSSCPGGKGNVPHLSAVTMWTTWLGTAWRRIWKTLTNTSRPRLRTTSRTAVRNCWCSS